MKHVRLYVCIAFLFSLGTAVHAEERRTEQFNPGTTHSAPKFRPDILIRKKDIWIGYRQQSGNSAIANSWVPVHIRIQNNSNRLFTADIRLRLSDGRTGNHYTTSYSRPVSLYGRGTKKHIVLHVYASDETEDGFDTENAPLQAVVSFENASHTVQPRPITIQSLQPTQPLGQDEIQRTFLLTLSSAYLSVLPPFTNQQANGTPRQIRRHIQGHISSLPKHWSAYQGFDAILWDGIDLSKLERDTANAIRDYIVSGGHLIVAIGEHRRMVIDSFLGKLLPCDIGTMQSRDLGNEILNMTDLDTAAAVPLTPALGTRALQVNPTGDGFVWTTTPTTAPLAVRGDIGNGTVTALSFSLFSAFLKHRNGDSPKAKEARRRWQAFSDLAFCRTATPLRALAAPELFRSAHTCLQESATLRIPSRRNIGTFLLIYLLTLGPLCYMIFRSCRRVESAWLVMPLVSIGFFAWSFRESSRELGKQISITDLSLVSIREGGTGNALTYSIIHNPSYRAYDIEFPKTKARPLHLRYNKRTDDNAFRQETFSLQTEESAGRMGIRHFQIPFNSRRCLAAQSLAHVGDGFQIRLKNGVANGAGPGTDGILGTIDNHSGQFFRHALLLTNRTAYRLAPIPPGTNQILREQTSRLSNRDSLTRTLKSFSQDAFKQPCFYEFLLYSISATIGDSRQPHLILLSSMHPLDWQTNGTATPSFSRTLLSVACPWSETKISTATTKKPPETLSEILQKAIKRLHNEAEEETLPGDW